MGELTHEEMHHFLEGCRRFDSGRHWDSHESWEDLWNLLKKREEFQQAKIVQGLIQTAALLYNYARQKKRGVELGWLKLEKKLVEVSTYQHIDISKHLDQIRLFFEDVGHWSLDPQTVILPLVDDRTYE